MPSAKRKKPEIPPPPDTKLIYMRRGQSYYGFGVKYFKVQARMENVLLLLARRYLKTMPAVRNLTGTMRMVQREHGDVIEELPSHNQLKLWSLGGILNGDYPWLILPWNVTAGLLDRGILPDWALFGPWPSQFTEVLETAICQILEQMGGKFPPGMGHSPIAKPHDQEAAVHEALSNSLAEKLGKAPPPVKFELPESKTSKSGNPNSGTSKSGSPEPKPKPTPESKPAWDKVQGVQDARVEDMSDEQIQAELEALDGVVESDPED